MNPTKGWCLVDEDRIPQCLDVNGRLSPARYSISLTLFENKAAAISALQRITNFVPGKYHAEEVEISARLLHDAKPRLVRE